MTTNETKAMTAVARERDAFEATWTQYVNALEQHDAAVESLRALKGTRRPGHWRRIAAGTRRTAERAHAVLSTRFGMDLGGVL